MNAAKKKAEKRAIQKPPRQVIAPPHPLPPKMSEAGVADYRTQFAKLSLRKGGPWGRCRTGIYSAKLKLLRTHPAFHPADRKLAVRLFRQAAARATKTRRSAPAARWRRGLWNVL